MIDAGPLRDIERRARYALYSTTEDQRDELATLALMIAQIRTHGISTATRQALDRDARTLAPELQLVMTALDQLAKTATS